MAKAKLGSTFFDGFSPDEVEEVDDSNLPEVEEDEKTEDEGTLNLPPIQDEEEVDTNEEDKESTEDTDDVDFFTTIIEEQAAKGLLFYDEEKEYEGTGEEIFDEVVQDTLEKRFQEEYLEKIPEEYHSIFEHLRQGKSLTEWVEAVKPTDYSKIDLDDETTQKSLIEEHLALTGMDEDDIKDLVKEYEDAGTLDKNSKKALKYLQKNEDKKAEAYEKQLEKDKEELEERQAREFDKFKADVLSTEELGKRKLDKKEREKLLDHITKPVNKKGESQYVINQKSREKQLQLAYLDMIGFDFSKLEKQAETKAVSGLRAKLTKTTDINGKKTGSSGRVNTDTSKIVRGPWDSIS